MVPVEISPELPNHADEDLNFLKEGVVRLVQGERPPSRLLPRSAVGLRRERGAHTGIEPGLRSKGRQGDAGGSHIGVERGEQGHIMHGRAAWGRGRGVLRLTNRGRGEVAGRGRSNGSSL